MTAQQKSGAVVLSDDLKNPAMEKLDLVRKWSINTYKVILFVFGLFLCLTFLCFSSQPQSLSSLLIRMLAEKWTIPDNCNFFAVDFVVWLLSVTLCSSFSLGLHSNSSQSVTHSILNAVNLLLMRDINKPSVLCSVLGKSCQRSWVVARGLWTWS